jgi:hypothetical protein
LEKQARRRESVGQVGHIPGGIGVPLDGGTRNPSMTSRRPVDRKLAEQRVAPVAFPDLAEKVPALSPGGRSTRVRHKTVPNQELKTSAEIVGTGFENFAEGVAGRGQGGTRDHSTFTILVGDPRGHERRSSFLSVPEESRPHDETVVAREVGPAIAVEVIALVKVASTEQRHAPPGREGAAHENHPIGAAHRGTVDQSPSGPLAAGAARDQIHHSTHGVRSVQRRGDPLDHFDLTKVHGRNLQESKTAHLLSEQRQAVRQKSGVPALHPLDAHTGGAQ